MQLTLINHNIPNTDRIYENIPSKSGIYGWFYNYSYIKNFSNNPEKIKKLLLEASEKLKNPDFRTYLSAKFGNQFKGEISYIGRFKENIINEKIDTLNEDEIKLLFDVLQNFSQPLYIGIADNLRSRYIQHYKSITEEICDMKLSQGKCFGHRVQDVKIEIKELVYKYMELDIDRNKIENMEYIANRFFRPIFGRR